MGCLGPIDPSVANIFNPVNPQHPGQLAPISVEDVTAYFKLVQDEVGINHEDELIQALAALTEKIHPLALGNVQRSHHQSRLIARKLLKKHMSADQQHEIDQIIDNLKSNLFYHGHPINRDEAEKDLKLKVKKPDPELEDLMWNLFLEYEKDLNLNEPFSAIHELEQRAAPSTPAPPTVQEIVQSMQNLAANGIGLGPGLAEEQFVRLATAMIPALKGQQRPTSKVKLEKIPTVFVESISHADIFLIDMTLDRTSLITPQGPQDAIKQEVSWQRWQKEK